MITDPFRCICDPAVLFEPPDPRPVAVEGCPAHLARRVVQLWIRLAEPGPFGWRCVEHADREACDAATACRLQPVGGEP